MRARPSNTRSPINRIVVFTTQPVIPDPRRMRHGKHNLRRGAGGGQAGMVLIHGSHDLRGDPTRGLRQQEWVRSSRCRGIHRPECAVTALLDHAAYGACCARRAGRRGIRCPLVTRLHPSTCARTGLGRSRTPNEQPCAPTPRLLIRLCIAIGPIAIGPLHSVEVPARAGATPHAKHRGRAGGKPRGRSRPVLWGRAAGRGA
jgi:hypothetical protein